jgi:hypothetical protein
MGKRRYEVACLDGKTGELVSESRGDKPLLGGYRFSRPDPSGVLGRYGDPDYCPTATPRHKQALAEKGEFSSLVWFDSVAAAVRAEFSPCGNCWIERGDPEQALFRWREYDEACRDLGVEPGNPHQVVREMRNRQVEPMVLTDLGQLGEIGYGGVFKEGLVSGKEVYSDETLSAFLYPGAVGLKDRRAYNGRYCSFVPRGYVVEEGGGVYPLTFRAVQEREGGALVSLGLRNNPHILEYHPGKWVVLGEDDVVPGSGDFGGIWTARDLGGTKQLMEEEGRQLWATAVLNPIYANSYRVKSVGIKLIYRFR